MKITDEIKTIVTHASCPDGKASAIILRNVFPDAEVKFLQHNSKEHLELPAEPGMIFCDFSPPRERYKEFVNAGAYVLDHHKHQKDIVEAFGERGLFADESKEPGYSGALLAYKVWENNTNIDWRLAQIDNTLRDFATLAGIRDCWVKESPRWIEACEQAAALHFYSEEYLLENGFSEAEKKLGKYLYEQILKKAKKTAQEKLIIRDKIAIMSGLETSDVADAAFELYDIDVLVGFGYVIEDGKSKVIVSMRSRNGCDVGAIAKAYGGGGHTQAAGFQISNGNEIVDSIFEILKR